MQQRIAKRLQAGAAYVSIYVLCVHTRVWACGRVAPAQRRQASYVYGSLQPQVTASKAGPRAQDGGLLLRAARVHAGAQLRVATTQSPPVTVITIAQPVCTCSQCVTTAP